MGTAQERRNPLAQRFDRFAIALDVVAAFWEYAITFRHSHRFTQPLCVVEIHFLAGAMDAARFLWQGGIPMMRQFLSRGLVLGAIVASTTGCETLHSTVRHKNNDDAAKQAETSDESKPDAVDSDVSKLKSVDSTDKDAQPFFKSTRNRSAWSSFSPEAQQIEKDLGVY